MKMPLLAIIGLMIFIPLTWGLASADPIKWSAPMNHYPNPWSPTAAPPNYQNYYPYAAYGYGGYGTYPGYGHGGYGGYGGYYQGQYPGAQQGGGFSGNPYQYYYQGQ